MKQILYKKVNLRLIYIQEEIKIQDMGCLASLWHVTASLWTSDGQDQDLVVETETETFILGLMGSRPRPRLLV